MEQAKKNIGVRLQSWLKEIRSELKKVVWPTFEKVRQNTLVVILYVLMIGLVITALDWVFTNLLGLIIK